MLASPPGSLRSTSTVDGALAFTFEYVLRVSASGMIAASISPASSMFATGAVRLKNVPSIPQTR